MTTLLRLMALTCLLIAPAAARAENEKLGTVSAKLDGGEERQWFSVVFYDEPSSTYWGETSPELVTITAHADADKVFAGDAITIDFSVVGDPAAPKAKWGSLTYHPGNSIFPHYTSEYEDFQLTITTITMNEKSATVAGSFSAKLTRGRAPEPSLEGRRGGLQHLGGHVPGRGLARERLGPADIRGLRPWRPRVRQDFLLRQVLDEAQDSEGPVPRSRGRPDSNSGADTT